MADNAPAAAILLLACLTAARALLACGERIFVPPLAAAASGRPDSRAARIVFVLAAGLALAGCLLPASAASEGSLSRTAGMAIFVSLLALAGWTDWRTMLLPDSLGLGGAAFFCLFAACFPRAVPPSFFFPDDPANPALFAGLLTLGRAAFALAVGLGLYYSGKILFKNQIARARRTDPDIDSAIGLGDVKLMALVGARLGLGLFQALFIAALAASAFGIAEKIRSGSPGNATGLAALSRRWNSGDSVLPFGPFLALGGVGALMLERFGVSLFTGFAYVAYH